MEPVLELDNEEQLISEEESKEDDDNGDKELVLSNCQALRDLDMRDGLYPKSYRTNSDDEIRLVAIANNFQRQYSHLYPDRKPLLFCPVNECGVKKFVSTTLRPTPTTYPQLFTWDGCASFVADFLSLDLLELPTELPRFLFSPTSVLQRQRGTCFEFASLLCSLLLGAHYDAYCVSGYATREMCLVDQSRLECPLLDSIINSEVSGATAEQEPQQNKYAVKPPEELKSRYLAEQEKKKQEAEAALLQKQHLQEEDRPPSADHLRGLRVHCWVLVLSGSRSIEENFFIDPLTGKSYSTDDDNFLGIENVWNNLNYYVNMQDCSNGCADIMYDLEDLRMWEPVLYGSASSKRQLILDALKKKEHKMMNKVSQDEEEEQEEPRPFQVPRSWVTYITITGKDVETRWPGGQKVTHYKKTKLENFAPYVSADGLVTRLTTYTDLDCTEVSVVKEWYQYRNDHLEERQINKVDGYTTERFKHGRRYHLLFHRFKSQNSATAEQEMQFSRAHQKDVVRRVISPSEMTEFFKGRDDFLSYRHVVFRQPPQTEHYHPKDLQMLRVVERFNRNKSKRPSEDVAERVFLLTQRRIEVTYHLEENRFIPSRRTFTKPEDATRKRVGLFKPELVSSFQVDLSEKPPDTLTLYEMLQALLMDEMEVIDEINMSKDEVNRIVSCRKQEERAVQLLSSPWTTTGIARACEQKEEMERLAAEEQRWLQDREKDILAHLLIRLDDAEVLSAENAKQLHQDCLAEYKQRLVEQANLIQERYEKETQELQEKQEWYHKNQLHITVNEEKEYHDYCAEKTLRITVAKKRLSMHKDSAPQKFLALDQRLKRDPRLAPHLLG